MLSMTSDYAVSTGCPEPYLRAIAEAGFTHVHWCHHWNTDFMYADCEVEQIARWLAELGLGLTDLHASAGGEKNWGSPRPYERQAGVELIANRIRMAERLAAGVIILHLPAKPKAPGEAQGYWQRVFSSLDDLQPVAARHGVRIAIENGNFDEIGKVFARCGAEFVGLCYDSGHGNVAGDGLDRLDAVKDRLISIHLHDNDGKSDQHKLPFTGTTDWDRLAGIIAASAYDKWVSLETTIHKTGIEDEAEFLAQAYRAASRLAEMIAAGDGKA
jgi:sugar phosphate isomerase/epimerase